MKLRLMISTHEQKEAGSHSDPESSPRQERHQHKRRRLKRMADHSPELPAQDDNSQPAAASEAENPERRRTRKLKRKAEEKSESSAFQHQASERDSDSGAHSDVIMDYGDEDDSYEEKPAKKVFKKRTAKPEAVDFELADPEQNEVSHPVKKKAPKKGTKSTKAKKAVDEANTAPSLIKAQNRLIGTIHNNDIYQEDDAGIPAANDASRDQFDVEPPQLEIAPTAGGKKEATFLQKLAAKPAEVNYGFLAPHVDLNQLAAKGVKVSSSKDDAESDSGLEFISEQAEPPQQQEEDKPRMLLISGQLVQACNATVNTRTDFLKSLREKKMVKTNQTITDLDELKKTFQTTELGSKTKKPEQSASEDDEDYDPLANPDARGSDSDEGMEDLSAEKPIRVDDVAWDEDERSLKAVSEHSGDSQSE